jgi:hypothetical protein
MKSQRAAHLLLHGIALILLGAGAGFVYTGVLTGDIEGGAQAWRFAHLNGLLNGAILVAISGASLHIALPEGSQRRLVFLTISGSYSNVVASIVGAQLGQRGLSAAGPGTNVLVFGLFVLAVVTLLPGLVLVLAGAWRTLAGGDGSPGSVHAATQQGAGADRADPR